MEILKKFKKQKSTDTYRRQKENRKKNMRTLNTEYSKDFVMRYKGVLEDLSCYGKFSVKHSHVNRSVMETIIKNKDEILELEKQGKAIEIVVPFPYTNKEQKEEPKKDRINVL